MLTRDQESTTATINRLRRLARADYESGRTVRLKGWIVSRTEGRLFAAAIR